MTNPGVLFLVVLYADTVPSIGLASTDPEVMTNDSSGWGSGPVAPKLGDGMFVVTFLGDDIATSQIDVRLQPSVMCTYFLGVSSRIPI